MHVDLSALASCSKLRELHLVVQGTVKLLSARSCSAADPADPAWKLLQQLETLNVRSDCRLDAAVWVFLALSRLDLVRDDCPGPPDW